MDVKWALTLSVLHPEIQIDGSLAYCQNMQPGMWASTFRPKVLVTWTVVKHVILEWKETYFLLISIMPIIRTDVTQQQNLTEEQIKSFYFATII